MSYVPGDIVRFHNPKFPEDIHPHVIVARKSKTSYLVVCSSQTEKVKERCAYIEGKGIADKLDTFVSIPARSVASMSEHSAVNCNEIFEHDLLVLQQQEELEFSAREKDNVSPDLLKQIKTALCNSRRIDPDLKVLLQ